MRTVKASEFKAKCLKIMDEVAATGEPVVITKYGVPVAQLVPAMQKPKTLFGALKIKPTSNIFLFLGLIWNLQKSLYLYMIFDQIDST